MSSSNKKERLKNSLKSVSNQDFEVQKVFESDFFSGVAVVKNNKLAGRLEDVKFLESVEPNLKEQFRKEAKILSAIQHENIPRVYDLIEEGDKILFRSEHVEGYSLKEVLQAFRERDERFPKDTASTIILKLMKALHYAHNDIRYKGKKKSLTHRDIKPSNIILSAKNCLRKDRIDDNFLDLVRRNKVEPYLIDFGIARFKGDITDKSGTVAYLSPAQAGSEYGKQDWRTDLYQLLLVYSEMLTGKQPFAGLARSKIISRKKNKDFKLAKSSKIQRPVKSLIGKGMKRNPEEGFKSEREVIKTLSKLNSRQRKVGYVKKQRKPLIALFLLALIISLASPTYNFWDSQTRSTDALVRAIESNPNPTIEELELALHKIQKRAFEKKYYEPLLQGKFRDAETGELFYPSHLNTDGEWVFVGPSDNDAGAFAGLLFNHVDEYPELLAYAVEYVQPILEAEFDGPSPNRFAYALIPAYEASGDEMYLEKLVSVAESLKGELEMRKGMIQSADFYRVGLFLWLYQETGEEKYLETSERVMLHYMEHNIDANGYVYEYTLVNATSPYGPMPDAKMSKLVTSFEEYQTGGYIPLGILDEEEFKRTTAIFSRDFAEAMQVLDELYRITDKTMYPESLGLIHEHYKERMSDDNVDFLFVSHLNQQNNIPKDTLGAVKAVTFFKGFDKELYYQKLKALLSAEYLRTEKENGIVSQSVFLKDNRYEHSDETTKNQSLILTDRLFLEIK